MYAIYFFSVELHYLYVTFISFIIKNAQSFLLINCYPETGPGGNDILEECHMHDKLQGDTLPGDIFVSKAGRLTFKRIVHAVAPKWVGGGKNEENLLFVAIEKALTEAVQSRLQTVALPASFAESYGYPVDVAVRTIVNAITSFLKDRPPLKEILIVARNQSEAGNFVREINAIEPPPMLPELAGGELSGKDQRQQFTANAAPAADKSQSSELLQYLRKLANLWHSFVTVYDSALRIVLSFKTVAQNVNDIRWLFL